jgi:hypothetical protein
VCGFLSRLLHGDDLNPAQCLASAGCVGRVWWYV